LITSTDKRIEYTDVSGTLERGHLRESVAFVKQLIPEVRRIAFVVKDSSSGRAIQAQVESEAAAIPAEVTGFFLVRTIAELEQLSTQLRSTADAVYMDSLEGIQDEGGKALVNREVFEIFRTLFPGPIIGANRYHVEEGALCAVVKTGHEQGETAARLLLEAMQGRPVAEIGITRNFRGRRMINVTTLSTNGNAAASPWKTVSSWWGKNKVSPETAVPIPLNAS